MDGKVPLHISNGVAYVWSVDDVEALRVTHRICGTLSGTLPSVSQQNMFLGVPLTLLPEEVATLVDTGAACIVHDSISHGKPTESQLTRWVEARKLMIQAEIKEKEREAAAKTANIRIDASDKARKKRLEREARKDQVRGELTPEPEAPPPIAPPQTHTVHVPGPSSELPWYSARIFHSLKDARDAGVWTYPNDVKERAECAVFRNLWEKGNYLGPGIKFGGNYLVYPGDPLRFHSHFVASVHTSPTSLIRPMDIVAFGRLGTATKKVHLLCGYDDDTGAVTYYSIEWASFG